MTDGFHYTDFLKVIIFFNHYKIIRFCNPETQAI